MTKMGPLIVFLVFGSALTVLLLDPLQSDHGIQPYETLEGTLFKGDMTVFAPGSLNFSDSQPLPETGGPEAVRPIETSEKGGLLPLASHESAKVPGKRRLQGKKGPSGSVAAAAAVALSMSSVEGSSMTVRPLPIIRQRSVDTYSSLNAAMEASLLNYPLTARVKRGDIVLKLEQVAKVETQYLLRFSVANNEKNEFFLSKVLLFANQNVIVSHEHMPFSCRSGELIYGIVKFSSEDVKGKRVGFTLTESGNGARKYDIKAIDYGF